MDAARNSLSTEAVQFAAVYNKRTPWKTRGFGASDQQNNCPSISRILLAVDLLGFLSWKGWKDKWRFPKYTRGRDNYEGSKYDPRQHSASLPRQPVSSSFYSYNIFVNFVTTRARQALGTDDVSHVRCKGVSIVRGLKQERVGPWSL